MVETPDNAPRKGKIRGTWRLYVLFAVVAGFVGLLVSASTLSESLVALGIPDPGKITTLGLPFLRAATWIFASLAGGSFLASAFFISPKLPGGDNLKILNSELTIDGYLAARTGAVASLTLAFIALMQIPMVLSDVTGTPLSHTLNLRSFIVSVQQVADSQGWLAVAIIAATVGVTGLFSRFWRSQPLLFVASLISVVPLAFNGHSASGGDHDFGLNSYLWHIIFMILWVGGLMALVAHCRRLGPDTYLAVRRYSGIALIAIVAVATSGVINAVIRIEWSDWLTTPYGLIITSKAVGAIILGLFGFMHRQLSLPALERNPNDTRIFRRIAIVEILVMAAMCGLAVSMGRTPPPTPDNPDLSPMELAVGFRLEVEPTLSTVFTMWRFDLIFAGLAIVLGIAYLRGVIALYRRGEQWPWYRTMWFLLGCISLGVMMSSGMGMNSMALFSMHMIVHMGLSMVIPVFLVLGNPFTLIFKSVAPGEPGHPGLHEWVYALCNSRIIRALTWTPLNTIQFVFFFYLIYVTPIYDALVDNHAGHVTMNVLFLLSGFLYFWEMIGGDPIPNRRSVLYRLAWLLFSMPFHLFFGVYLMQLTNIIGYDFYSEINLPWDPDLLADQRAGGGIAWAAGSFPLIVVFGALFRQWLLEDRKEEKEYEQRAEEDNDAELEEYNRWLAAVNSGEEPESDYYDRDMRDDRST